MASSRVGERSEDLDGLRLEPYLLLGLTKRGGEEVVVARLGPSTGQPELAPVDAVVGADEEEDPKVAFRVTEHRREDGGILQGQASARRGRRRARAGGSPRLAVAARARRPAA